MYGSGVLDKAVSPAGTFSLSDMHKGRVPMLREVSVKGDVAVVVRAIGSTSATARYIKRADVMAIFTKALERSEAFDQARFDDLLKDRPIDDKAIE